MGRAEIISDYKQTIEKGGRARLSKEKHEILIDGFIDKLAGLRLSAKIEEACNAEIQLLELGYAEETISKARLPEYKKAAKKAHAKGRLPNSNAHAHDVTFQKGVVSKG